MNRRGTLEWSLETVGKLVFYVLILIAIVYMSYQIISLFINGNEEYTAKRNLQLLEQRMNEANDLGEEEGTLILAMPPNYLIRTYGIKEKSTTIGWDCKNSWATIFIKVMTNPFTDGYDVTRTHEFSVTLDKPGRFGGCKSGHACVCLFKLPEKWSCEKMKEEHQVSIVSCFVPPGPDETHYYEPYGRAEDGLTVGISDGLQNAKVVLMSER